MARKPADRFRPSVDSSWNETIEWCTVCERETPHQVAIERRSESPDPTHAAPSREPYRVSTCRHCGTETVVRMNRA